MFFHSIYCELVGILLSGSFEMMMNQEDDTKVGPKQRYNTTAAAAVLLLCSHPLLVKEKDGEKQATLHHSFLTKIQALTTESFHQEEFLYYHHSRQSKRMKASTYFHLCRNILSTYFQMLTI